MKLLKQIFIIILCLAPCALKAEELPSILSDSDAQVYAKIFDLQSHEKMAEAEKLQKEISDPLLMSDVLYQRYMSKTYRTSAKEIADWMGKYYDQPGAETLGKLAQKRKISARSAKSPAAVALTGDSVAYSENWTSKTYGGDTGVKINRIKSALRRGHTKNARDVLEDRSFRKKISAEDYGRLCGRLSFLYYADGNFDMARMWGEIAAESKSEYGLWTMGLLYYKEGEFAAAESHFSSLATLDQINAARKQEAAFWAGRAACANDDKAVAQKFWKEAAKRPQTFYGALASASLGEVPKYQFFDSDWSREDFAALMKTGYGISALALIQVGEKARAESHLRYLIAEQSSDRLLHAVHAVAATAELPRAAMQVSALVRERGIEGINDNVIASAQYPLPDWEPMGGWSIDRALLFAVVRQESGFKTTAKSRVGANGVMQIMPGTAKLVAKQNKVKMSDMDMSNPEHNMFLGQQHIADLLSLSSIDNNIIKMLVAYNAGPGMMSRWEKKFQTEDPLLYIESFPAVETRGYLKRVLSNLWLYRARLNQPMTGVRELADGIWPRYESSDKYVGTTRANREI